jgi:hypothetical protein
MWRLGENDRGQRSEAASRFCGGIGQFAVIDLPNLRYSSGRIIASEISDRVCHVPRYVGQDDSPGDNVRPRLWPERTNQSLVRYPRTQHLSGFCIGHDLRRDTEIPVRVLLGFEHTQILAGLGQWTKSGVTGKCPHTISERPGIQHVGSTLTARAMASSNASAARSASTAQRA